MGQEHYCWLPSGLAPMNCGSGVIGSMSAFQADGIGSSPIHRSTRRMPDAKTNQAKSPPLSLPANTRNSAR